MAVSQEKITVHSLADLKNTSDDAIPAYLNSLKFSQSHFLSDVRLALGYTAFAICAACFYWDYKLGFESTKYYSAAAVAFYTAINGCLTYWIWGVEKGKVYVGVNEKGERIEIITATTKHVPVYNLTVTTYTKDRPSVPNTIKFSRPFADWFDAAGHFVTLPFQQLFASNVTLIAQADPKRAVQGKGKKVAKAPVDDSKTMDEKWASLLAESSGPGDIGVVEASSTATPGKGSKRRGKKA